MARKRNTAEIGFNVAAISLALATGSLLVALALGPVVQSPPAPNPGLVLAVYAALCLFWPSVGAMLIGLVMMRVGRKRERSDDAA